MKANPPKQSLVMTGLLAGVLIVITITSYLPAIKAGFIWDDDYYVTDNPLLAAPDGLRRIWFSRDSPSQYFPMTYTTFRLEYAMWKLNPAGYHVTNILLHTVNALLLWGLLKRLSVPGAWLAGAIFALHPVNVESVAWITERKNLLMTFFSFLSLLCWLRFCAASLTGVDYSKEGRLKWYFYSASLLLYTIALFSKTTACTLPAGLLLLLWLKDIPITVKRLLQIAPYFVLGFAMGVFVMWWEKHHQGAESLDMGLNLLEKLLLASRALWFYAGKLLWPVNLAFSYHKWQIDWTKPLQYTWLVALLIVACYLWFWRDKVGPGVVAAIVFFAATLFPMLGFFPLYTFFYSYVADHYQYMACIGPISLVSALGCLAAARLGYRGKIAATSAVVFIMGLLWLLTWRQCYVYKDSETLWRDTLKKNPQSTMAHNNLATALRAKGRLDESLGHSREAVRLSPDSVEALGNLAAGLQLQGKLDEAIEYYRRAVQNMKEYGGANLYADAYNGLGSALLRQGKPDEAFSCFINALELRPDHLFAHLNLSTMYARQGKLKEALEYVDKALQINPGSPEALNLKQSLLRQVQNEKN
jgi:tetratricopeptide (TPR) repeat protein